MILDDVIAWIRREQPTMHYEECSPNGVCDSIVRYIEANRPALEAGMKGTLRWVLCLPPSGGSFWVEATPNGEAIANVHGEYYEGTGYSDKESCRKYSEVRGLTAEFVEVPDGTE